MFDLVIRNGMIVDGTGAASYVGDVAVQDGAIVEIAPSVTGTGSEEIDATGCIVTPGFVDVHTHYDGQAMFDDTLSPSNGHGVTTVVLGVCGVGFAPVRPSDHELLVTTMESVEDIPGDVLREGLTWDWESFPEYLDALDRRTFALDIAAQIGHVALRTHVMGDRGVDNEPATEADIASMAGLAREAIEAGAVGFSTSRVASHTTAVGVPVPGTHASEDELFGIAEAIAGTGRRVVFQLAEAGIDGVEPESTLTELEWMSRLSAEHSIPVSFLLLQSGDAPDLWRRILETCDEARGQGAELVGQVSNRPFGMLLGLTTRHPFMKRETFHRLRLEHESLDALVAELRKPEVRAAILAEGDTVDTGDKFEGMGMLVAAVPQMVYPLTDPVDYEPPADHSIAALAEAAEVSPLECYYDLMLEADGRAMFVVPFFNYVDGDHEVIHEMLRHPTTVPGLGDGGAHLGTICDASMPTYQLSHWVTGRERGPRLGLEEAVRMQTHDTAALYGLDDRGVLEAGRKADLNVIDLDRLQLELPRLVSDLPAGGSRLTQDASGYVATVVTGVITRRNDSDTGARPGRLVRGS